MDDQALARAAAQTARRKAAEAVKSGGDPMSVTVDDAELPGAAVAVRHSEAELVERLSALARAAGSAPRAVKLLADQGIESTRQELDVLRELHTPMYMALAEEVSRAVEEGIAQSYREIVVGAQRLTKSYIDEMQSQVDAGDMPRDMDRTVQSLAKVLGTATDKLLSITGRPVSGAAGADPLEAIRELEKLGVIKQTEKPVDTDAVEIP